MRRRHDGISPVRAGTIALVVIGIGAVPRLHQGHPVHEAVRGRGGLHARRTRSAPARRSASPASTSARSSPSRRRTAPTPPSCACRSTSAGCRCTRDATAKIRPRIFLEGNFFVDLKPGSPGAPVLDAGDTIKVTQTADAGAARRGAHRAAERHARGPQGGPRRARRRPEAGRARLQRRLRRHRRRRALDRCRQPGVPGRRSPRRTSSGCCAAWPTRPRAWTATRSSSRSWSRTSTARWAPSPPSSPRCRRRSASSGRRSRPPTAPSTAQRRVPERARVLARDPAGRAGDAGDDRGRLPVGRADAQAAAPERAARARAGPVAGVARPRAARQQVDEAVPAGRGAVEVRDEHDPADGRHRDPRRVRHRPAQLPRVHVRAGRPRRRVAELRRQRPVRALPAGRRLDAALARRRRDAGRRRLRQRLPRRRRAAGQAEDAAAVQRRHAVLPIRSSPTSTARGPPSASSRGRTREARDPQALARLRGHPRAVPHLRRRSR